MSPQLIMWCFVNALITHSAVTDHGRNMAYA